MVRVAWVRTCRSSGRTHSARRHSRSPDPPSELISYNTLVNSDAHLLNRMHLALAKAAESLLILIRPDQHIYNMGTKLVQIQNLGLPVI